MAKDDPERVRFDRMLDWLKGGGSTFDKLKIRSEPGLKSKVLGELPLFSEVYFMDEVTDSVYTVSLGKEIAEEPDIKVKTQRGTVGWVYGAGVNYYKKKRAGGLE